MQYKYIKALFKNATLKLKIPQYLQEKSVKLRELNLQRK